MIPTRRGPNTTWYGEIDAVIDHSLRQSNTIAEMLVEKNQRSRSGKGTAVVDFETAGEKQRRHLPSFAVLLAWPYAGGEPRAGAKRKRVGSMRGLGGWGRRNPARDAFGNLVVAQLAAERLQSILRTMPLEVKDPLVERHIPAKSR